MNTEDICCEDCSAAPNRPAEQVAVKLAQAQREAVDQVERAASVHAAHGDRPGISPDVAGPLDATVTRLARVAQLQAVAVSPADPHLDGSQAEPGPGGPVVRMAFARSALDGSTPAGSALDGSVGTDIVCTLEGGLDAMRGRLDDWQGVLARATGRRPADGGVTLTFGHDPAVAVALARLAAAEFACCSFFTFALSIGPEGMRFTVTAPEDARTVVTAVFGAGLPVPADHQ
jgi:hypothetical protein